jgi:hypothetical protein
MFLIFLVLAFNTSSIIFYLFLDPFNYALFIMPWDSIIKAGIITLICFLDWWAQFLKYLDARLLNMSLVCQKKKKKLWAL